MCVCVCVNNLFLCRSHTKIVEQSMRVGLSYLFLSNYIWSLEGRRVKNYFYLFFIFQNCIFHNFFLTLIFHNLYFDQVETYTMNNGKTN